MKPVKFHQIIMHHAPGIFLPEWARSALVGPGGSLYVPAAMLAGEDLDFGELAIAVRSVEDGARVAIIDNRPFVEVDWAWRSMPWRRELLQLVIDRASALLMAHWQAKDDEKKEDKSS